ncbi:MAG: outer membrane beta-barrel protein, partial [Bacteroidota bacterium]
EVPIAEDSGTADSMQEKLTLDADVPLTDDAAIEAALNAAMGVPTDAPMDFDETAMRDPRWVVGAALSPLYSFRDAEPQVTSSTTGYESGMLSYAGGVHVGYRTTGRLAIETGVFFNKMGLDIDAPGIQMYSNELDLAPIAQDSRAYNASMSVMAASQTIGNIVSQSGDVYVNQYKLNASSADNKGVESFNTQVPADQGIRQHLDYMEVPLNLRYTLVDRSIEFQLIGGMSTNILVNNYVTMEGVDGETEIGYLTNIRNVNYSGNAGVGLVYHLLEHLSLSVEPRFRYFLHSVNDATLPSTRPYTFGLYTGLNFLF